MAKNAADMENFTQLLNKTVSMLPAQSDIYIIYVAINYNIAMRGLHDISVYAQHLPKAECICIRQIPNQAALYIYISLYIGLLCKSQRCL